MGQCTACKLSDRALWLILIPLPSSAVAFWQCLLPPVLASSPSAIPYSTPNGTPGMGARELVWWTEFLEEKGVKGVSKDLWYLVSPQTGPLLSSPDCSVGSQLIVLRLVPRHSSLSIWPRYRTRLTSTTTTVSLLLPSRPVRMLPARPADLVRRARSLLPSFRRVAIRFGRLYRACEEAENEGGRHGPLLRPVSRRTRREEGGPALMMMPFT